jgi:hypothetical protein
MMEEIRVYLMERWQKNREAAAKFEWSVLPKIKKKLEKEIEYTNMWRLGIVCIYFFLIAFVWTWNLGIETLVILWWIETIFWTVSNIVSNCMNLSEMS